MRRAKSVMMPRAVDTVLLAGMVSRWMTLCGSRAAFSMKSASPMILRVQRFQTHLQGLNLSCGGDDPPSPSPNHMGRYAVADRCSPCVALAQYLKRSSVLRQGAIHRIRGVLFHDVGTPMPRV